MADDAVIELLAGGVRYADARRVTFVRTLQRRTEHIVADRMWYGQRHDPARDQQNDSQPSGQRAGTPGRKSHCNPSLTVRTETVKLPMNAPGRWGVVMVE